MSGAVLLLPVARLFGVESTVIPVTALVSTALGWAVKTAYWRFIDTTRSGSTVASATGLGGRGRVRLLDPPHTEANYLMREMVFRIARTHAARLRRLAHGIGFAAPMALNALSLAIGGAAATVVSIASACCAALGLAIERWLFFAEAKHTVALYYGQDSA
jgi:DMSO reductase anchor subunit